MGCPSPVGSSCTCGSPAQTCSFPQWFLVQETFSLLIDYLYFVYSDHSCISNCSFLFYFLAIRFLHCSHLFLPECLQWSLREPNRSEIAAIYRDELSSFNSMEAMPLRPLPTLLLPAFWLPQPHIWILSSTASSSALFQLQCEILNLNIYLWNAFRFLVTLSTFSNPTIFYFEVSHYVLTISFFLYQLPG